jgi:histidinol dehydrogenase
MPMILTTSDADFETRFTELLGQKREDSPDVDAAVAAIIADVRARGDQALVDLTVKFDRFAVTRESLRLTREEIAREAAKVSDEDRAALELASGRIYNYHLRQMPKDDSWVDAMGARLGWRWTAIDAAGIYVPGGLATYPSSVLMNAIPAKVAGVKRLVMCVPTPNGEINPLVMLAAQLSNVDEVWRIGGAQAIAALAYGTESMVPVDKITGPGNAYVAAAKRRVFGKVGIDMIAGPSEVVIVASGDTDPEFVALDLLAQAEHDESAQSILITPDASFGEKVRAAVEAWLPKLSRQAIAAASWANNGAVIVVRDFEEAARLTNRLAPEHLEIFTPDPEGFAAQIRHAGAVFLGQWTPEVIGDYTGGPNHVLPTARSARFSSGLSVMEFLKRTTIAKMTPEAVFAIGRAAESLAKAEGLTAHGLSVRARLDKLNQIDP